MRIKRGSLFVWLVLMGCLGWTLNGLAAPPTPVLTNQKKAEMMKDNTKFLKLPDLTIDYITITPSNPKLGENLTIQFAIKNIGSDVATPTLADLYAMGFAYALNIPSYINTQQLSPGQSQVFTYSGILKSQQGSYEITTGKHNFGVDMNLKKNPVESNYSNNYKVKEFYISPAGGASNQPLPDLTISVLVLSPPEPTNGGPATITMTVANLGPGPAGPTKAFFNGKSEVLQALGLPAGPTTIPIPALNPGQSDTFNYSAPGGKVNLPAGSYTLAALVNTAVGAIPETNTSYNSKTLNFTILAPKFSPVSKGQIELKTK
jgi:subtilase family serine protease